jgi:UDP-glucuronate 4-epimerase
VRVLVTGCNGFLGHHVTALLLARGHEVLGADRPDRAERSDKRDRKSAADEFRKSKRYHVATGDLAQWAFVRDLLKNSRVDAIFHAAGQYSIAYSTANLKHYIHGNLIAPVLIYEAAALAKVKRIVYASSQAISDARRPSGLYGASKGFGEDALAAYWTRHRIAGVCLRYGVLYGPMIRRDTDFFRTVNDHLARRPPRQGSQWNKRTPLIETRDAAEIAVRSLEAKTEGTITLPAIAEDRPHSYRDVLHVAAHLSGLPALNPDPEAEPAAPRWPPICDVSAVRQALGWSPSITLRIGMERYIEWARTATT